MGLNTDTPPKAEKQEEMVIEYNIGIACPVCNEMNNTIYIPHHKETFKCSRCGQQNMIMMSFLAIKDNPQGVQTMMIDNRQFEKRQLNKKIGGVVASDKFIKREEFPDSGGI